MRLWAERQRARFSQLLQRRLGYLQRYGNLCRNMGHFYLVAAERDRNLKSYDHTPCFTKGSDALTLSYV
jgi:hypothetical protein